MRILVTGSRNLNRLSVVRAALTDDLGFGKYAGTPPPDYHPGQHWTLVHGGAQGADRLAEIVAKQKRMTVERYDADWCGPCAEPGTLDPLNGTPWCPPGHRKVRRDGSTYCPRAGHRRNQHMVDLGADVCVAFPVGPSHGTRDCMRRARAAGIEVREHEAGRQQ